METTGQLLKKKRIERGLSLADVQEATKISMQSLAALEEDRLDAFPNRVYSRAFLRDYANYLGLDSSALLDQQETDWTEVQASAPKQKTKKPRSRAFGYALVLVILGCVAGANLHYHFIPMPKLPKKPATIVKPGPGPKIPPEPNRNPFAPPVVKPTPTTNPPAPNHTTKEPVVINIPAGQVKVELTAVGQPVWIMVTVDGKKEFMNTLPAGGTGTFVGKNVFVLSGKANRLSVKLNGKSMGFFGNRPNVVKKNFTPASVPK
jgi:transcriptional regulator with XRE-family HTH domain